MQKDKVIIFGAGGTAFRVYNMIKKEVDVICFVDNDKKKWGNTHDGLDIKNPQILKQLEKEYDYIVLGTLMGLHEVPKQLEELKIPKYKLHKDYAEISGKAKVMFLQRFAELVYKNNIKGSVGEAGVFRGEFAKEINYYFHDRTCYLFDTFEGFSEKDFIFEEKPSLIAAAHLKETSEDFVYNKMPYKENIVMKKGYFPNTTEGLEDIFCFINLDMDLYQPILEGLRYFYPRMSTGGIILIHDYFSEVYPNVEKAVLDYQKEINKTLKLAPIGDDISLAVIK